MKADAAEWAWMAGALGPRAIQPGDTLIGRYGTRYTVREVRCDRVRVRPAGRRKGGGWIPRDEADRATATMPRNRARMPGDGRNGPADTSGPAVSTDTMALTFGEERS